MTPDQISKVETIVNEVIQNKNDVKCEETTVEDAKTRGAIGLFVERYGDKVKMYSIGDFSKEICGGPHSGQHFEAWKIQDSERRKLEPGSETHKSRPY